MKKRLVALLAILLLCFSGFALAAEEDIAPGYSQVDAVALNAGTKYFVQASNEALWFRFTATETAPCTITFSSLSLRYYSNSTGNDLQVPITVSNRYGVTSGYATIIIPNNNVFQPVYDQDGAAQHVTFNAEADTEYYICININVSSQPSDKAEGFFTLSLCGESTHVLQDEMTVLTEPTCTNAGVSGQLCTLCGQENNLTELPALGHSFGDEFTFTEVTCTGSGMKGRVCAACGEEEITGVIPATGHTEGEAVEVRTPTCTEEGNLEYSCTTCNHLIRRETVPALGHQPDAYFIAANASCETDGLRKQYCTVCAALLDEEVIPAVGHMPGTMQVMKAATCQEDGYAEQRCTVCNIVLATETLAALGHVPGEFVQVRQNDILQTGLLTSSCEQCGEVLDSIELPAIGNYNIRFDTPASFYSIKGEDLSVVKVSDMTQSENSVGAHMSAYIQGNKLTVEETASSKLANLAYVPFTVSVCVPANTCLVATYTFDMTADKRATNGSALLLTRLVDLGYADIPDREVFDTGALSNDALIALVSENYKKSSSGSATLKVAFNNNSDEPQIVNHYFGLFAGINYASTYEHRLLTELTVTPVFEDMTASYTEENLVDFLNSLN